MVPHTSNLQLLKIFKVADTIENLIEKSMKNWKKELTSEGEAPGEVKIKRGIFQRDSLSPILCVITLLPLSTFLKDMKAG